MIKCLCVCETSAFSDSCVASFREEGCFATLLRLAVQELPQNPSRELVAVTLAICVGRWAKCLANPVVCLPSFSGRLWRAVHRHPLHGNWDCTLPGSS
jgi:hypothetical protein